MSLGFDLPAGSLEEAKTNLEGCSELIKMVYPIYNKQDILAKPPLVRIQFANLIKSDIGIDHDGDGETPVENTGSVDLLTAGVADNKKTTPKCAKVLAAFVSPMNSNPEGPIKRPAAR